MGPPRSFTMDRRLPSMNELNPLFDILKTILSFSVILTVLVAVHELGHFWAAKAFGMHVEAFAVMMGGIRESSLDDLREKKLASRPSGSLGRQLGTTKKPRLSW